MATFTWRDKVTVSVGEMSRAQALDCVRMFERTARVFTDVTELIVETDVIGVLNAPATVRVKDEIFTSGTRTITVGDETFTLTLPLTHEGFNALPMSLATAWASAMSTSNEWLLDTLKKTFNLTVVRRPEPPSGNAPSVEPNEMIPLTKITG